MAYTDLNSENRLVQQTFAEHLEGVLGWETVYAYTGAQIARDLLLPRLMSGEIEV